MSHVSYPASGTFESNGQCPSTHPVKLPQLMFEVIWDTTAFNDKALWPQDGSQPFVFSQGDKYVPRVLAVDLDILTHFCLTELDMVNMETTCLAGKVMPSRKPWTTTASEPHAAS